MRKIEYILLLYEAGLNMDDYKYCAAPSPNYELIDPDNRKAVVSKRVTFILQNYAYQLIRTDAE